MKKLAILILCAGIISCSKKEVTEPGSTGAYQIRIVAVDNNGAKSYTPISRVKSGKIAIEYETSEVADIKEYKVEISSDGLNFRTAKTIAADLNNPNKMYRDTLLLE